MNSKASFLLIALAILIAIPAFALPGGFTADSSSIPHDDPAANLAAKGGLPVFSVITQDGALPADDDGNARLVVYEMIRGRMQESEYHIQIKERGNTSRRFPKKSYRVKIVDEAGEKENASLLGLRSDDDWILNPMYTDTSKIREALGYALWDEINTSSVHAASTRVEYAEVFINGEYWGLYGVQERIDRKQVNGSKRSGILYKIIANDRPSPQELLSCGQTTVCRGFELSYQGLAVTRPWEPAAAYMALLEKEATSVRAALSIENTIDYGLWAMLCQAHDCRFKNQFLNCVYNANGYTMYKIPWDLNNTFGDVWKNDAEKSNYTDFRIGNLVIDQAFALLLESEDPAVEHRIRRRWEELRKTVVTEENLIQMAHELHAPLLQAIERDSARWPSSGMGNGNAANIRDIETYIKTILPKMDAFIFKTDQQQ